MSEKPDALYVMAASYDSVDEAVADYEAVKALYYEVKASDEFDAAVIAKNDEGKVDIVKKHEQPTRHGAAHGLGWGLAAGAVVALFPPVGIIGALAVGGGAGAALGALAGRTASALSRDDLKLLGEVWGRGEAGLVVVYGPGLAYRVMASVTRATSSVRRITDLSVEQLAEDLRAAEAASKAAAARA